MFGEIWNQGEGDDESLPPDNVAGNKNFSNEENEDSKLSDDDDEDDEPENDYQVSINFYGDLIHNSYTILLMLTIIFN